MKLSPKDLPQTERCSQCKKPWAILLQNVVCDSSALSTTRQRQKAVFALVEKHTFERCINGAPSAKRSASVWENVDGKTTADWSRGPLKKRAPKKRKAEEEEEATGNGSVLGALPPPQRKMVRTTRNSKKAAEDAAATAAEEPARDTPESARATEAQPVKAAWGAWLAKV